MQLLTLPASIPFVTSCRTARKHPKPTSKITQCSAALITITRCSRHFQKRVSLISHRFDSGNTASLNCQQMKKPNDACRVIAKFDSGDPAVIDAAVGKGRILLLTSGWQPSDSQLALSTRFPPLLTQAFSIACPVQRSQLVQTVGETIYPDELVATAIWTVTTPSGEIISSDSASSQEEGGEEDNEKSGDVRLTEPGRYTISGESEDGTPAEVLLIASLPLSESRTEPLPIGQLEVLGVGVQSDSVDEAEAAADPAIAGQLKSAELEDRQKWWRLFLLAGLILLLVESFWAAAIEKRQFAEVGS